ncbi:MAG: hypothetical protein NTZ49_02125 [Candidatus Parcubacteria bacterium]|nr:hypothetical protein [Candidatus Parcubacteria bacterium]
MKILLLLGLVVYWVAIIRIVYFKVKELLQLHEVKKDNTEDFNAINLDQVEIALRNRYGTLAFIIFVSFMITLMVISMMFMDSSI